MKFEKIKTLKVLKFFGLHTLILIWSEMIFIFWHTRVEGGGSLLPTHPQLRGSAYGLCSYCSISLDLFITHTISWRVRLLCFCSYYSIPLDLFITQTISWRAPLFFSLGHLVLPDSTRCRICKCWSDGKPEKVTIHSVVCLMN